jgi:hypothetical protein
MSGDGLGLHESEQFGGSTLHPTIVPGSNEESAAMIAAGMHSFKAISAAVAYVHYAGARRQTAYSLDRIGPKGELSRPPASLLSRFTLGARYAGSDDLVQNAQQSAVGGNGQCAVLQQTGPTPIANGPQSVHRLAGGKVQLGGVLHGQNDGMILACSADLSSMGALDSVGGHLGMIQKTVGRLDVRPVAALLGQGILRGGRHAGGYSDDSFEKRRSLNPMESNCLTAHCWTDAQTLSAMTEPPVRNMVATGFARTSTEYFGPWHRFPLVMGKDQGKMLRLVKV